MHILAIKSLVYLQRVAILFSIFTECCNTKRSNNTKVQSDNFIDATESSDHHRVSSMNSLQKVVKKIKCEYDKAY